MKICKECKHCIPNRCLDPWWRRILRIPSNKAFRNSRCARSRKVESVDRVTGEERISWVWCFRMRSGIDSGACKPEGILWESK